MDSIEYSLLHKPHLCRFLELALAPWKRQLAGRVEITNVGFGKKLAWMRLNICAHFALSAAWLLVELVPALDD